MNQSASENGIIEGLDILDCNISKFGSKNLLHLTRTVTGIANICSCVDLVVNIIDKYVR